jgi:hypothetical protein
MVRATQSADESARRQAAVKNGQQALVADYDR